MTTTTNAMTRKPAAAPMQLTAEQQQVAKVRDFLLSEAAMSRLRDVAAASLKPEVVVRFALKAMSKPGTGARLAECGQASLLLALMDAAACGLEPDGRKGHLVPFGKDVVFVPGYQGLIDRMRAGGGIADIWTEVVYPGDKFQWVRGDSPRIVHEPDPNHADYDDIEKALGVYACVRLHGGTVHSEYLPAKVVRRIKESVIGRAKNRPSPWKESGSEGEMWRKTAVRRIAKYIPHTPELTAILLGLDEDSDTRPYETKAVAVEVMGGSADASPSSMAGRIAAQLGTRPAPAPVNGNGNGHAGGEPEHPADPVLDLIGMDTLDDAAHAVVEMVTHAGVPLDEVRRRLRLTGAGTFGALNPEARAGLADDLRTWIDERDNR